MQIAPWMYSLIDFPPNFYLWQHIIHDPEKWLRGEFTTINKQGDISFFFALTQLYENIKSPSVQKQEHKGVGIFL